MSEIEKHCSRTIGDRGDRSCAILEEYSACRRCPRYAMDFGGPLDIPPPPEYLKEATDAAAESKIESDESVFSALVFKIRGEERAVRADALETIVSRRPIRTVPGRSNDLFRGLVNVGGELIIAVSLEAALKLDVSTPPAKDRRMLVVSDGEDKWAFETDEIYGVKKIPIKKIKKAPSTYSKSPDSVTDEIVELEGGSVALINADKFFDLLERRIFR